MSNDLSDAYARFKKTFFEECRELFADMEHQLTLLDEGERDTDILHAIFRAIHSIKAGAATFGYSTLVRLSHNFEALLDRLRNGHIDVTPELVRTLFRGADLVQDLVEVAESEGEPDDQSTASMEKEIESWMGGASRRDATSENQEVAADARLVRYRIEFRPNATLFKNANEPLLLFRELRELGSLEVVGDVTAIPPLPDMDPEAAYLSWVLYLDTEDAPERIEEVFEFVEDECVLAISVTDVRESDDGDEGFGLFGEDDGLDATAPAAPTIPAAMTDDDGAFGLFGDDDGLPTVLEAVQSSAEPQTPSQRDANQPAVAAQPTTTRSGGSIRVDLERIDKLVDMVGEIVITQSMLVQEMAANEKLRNSRVGAGMEELSHHIRELQDNVMAVRMQPVKSVFARMPRIVRDVAGKLDKKVRLVTSGESTEVDKTVIEELADPLTHMIRNSLDHGLETPEDRVAAGKPEEGTITLSAENRGGRIVIQIVDDGRGINRPKVLELARSKGVVAEDADLSDEEIDNLIFAPGFSTADEVTDLSGRGVGMDVVRRNIQSLGGRVSVQSEPGKGARFQMTLPLTLAVLDGMVVGIGDQRYVVPIGSIIETIRPRAEDVNELVGGGRVVNVRGSYFRLVPLGDIFGIKDAERDPSKGLVVLVEADGGRIVGLVVDMLAGQQQVVIKSLESNFQAVDGIASATILGDGSVCLIMDIDELADMEGVHMGAGASNGLKVPAE